MRNTTAVLYITIMTTVFYPQVGHATKPSLIRSFAADSSPAHFTSEHHQGLRSPTLPNREQSDQYLDLTRSVPTAVRHVEGKVRALNGSPSFAEWRFEIVTNERTWITELEVDGSFRMSLDLPAEKSATAACTIIPNSKGKPDAYYPALLPGCLADTSDTVSLEVIAIPKTWTINGGIYDNITQELDLIALFGPINDVESFYRKSPVLTWDPATIPLTIIVTIPADLPVATHEIRTEIASAIHKLEGSLGRNVVGKIVYIENKGTHESDGDPHCTPGGGGIHGCIHLSVLNSVNGRSGVDARVGSIALETQCNKWTTNQCLVGEIYEASGYISIFGKEGRFKQFKTLALHELLHAFGFKHACFTPSIMTVDVDNRKEFGCEQRLKGCYADPDNVLSSCDVAAASLYWTVAEEYWRRPPDIGLLEALAGALRQDDHPIPGWLYKVWGRE